MKLGEIKIEALRLMFADYASDMSLETLQSMKDDENFGTYLSNMPGAINRCFARFEDKEVVPLKRYTLPKSNGTATNGRIRFDLSILEDFGNVNRIIYEDTNDYNGNCSYTMETDTTIMLEEKDGDYILIYHPTIPRVDSGTDDDEEVDLPDKIACLIPYFIKGDLYSEDEPSVSASARNLFEASLDNLNKEVKTKQSHVNCVYSQTEV